MGIRWVELDPKEVPDFLFADTREDYLPEAGPPGMNHAKGAGLGVAVQHLSKRVGNVLFRSGVEARLDAIAAKHEGDAVGGKLLLVAASISTTQYDSGSVNGINYMDYIGATRNPVVAALEWERRNQSQGAVRSVAPGTNKQSTWQRHFYVGFPSHLNVDDDYVVDRLPGPMKIDSRETPLLIPADVLFDFDSSRLKPDADVALRSIVKFLASRPNAARVTITGHTDSRGSLSYNKKLSEDRASSVKLWLVSHGVPKASTFEVLGLGETSPIAPNTKNGRDYPAGRRLNRRVEIRAH